MAIPALSFFTREKESIKLYGFDLAAKDDNILAEMQEGAFPQPTPKAAQWSPNGLALAQVDPATAGVQVVVFPEGEGREEVFNLENAPKTTQLFVWSPFASMVATISPAQKGSTEANVHVWKKVEDEGFVCQAAFHHPKAERDKKLLQWSSDEALSARLLPEGHVHVYAGSDVTGTPLVELKLAHAVQSFEFAAVRVKGNLRARLAVFVPDIRDDLQRVVGPGEVTIWDLVKTGSDGVEAQERAKMNVASGQVAELLWNSTGSALIAHCQTEVDESGQSYYGGSKLVLLSSDGTFQKDLTESECTSINGGVAVQDVAWSPTRDEFILIHGFQPSQATLYTWDERSKVVTNQIVLLEKAHRNTIRFNHFGSLVCLAGFGNLAGQVDFFGRADDADEEKCDYVRVASCQANCTVSAEWAPDGRHFLTSVLAPRMRVDNGVSIWNALTGMKISGEDIEELFDAQWRPEPPESLRFLDVSFEEIEGASKELEKLGTLEGAKEKKSAYRPPKARGDGASTVAAMMRGEVAAPDPNSRKRQPRVPARTREEGGEEGSHARRGEDMPWNQAQERRERTDTGPPSSPAADNRASPEHLGQPTQPPQQLPQHSPLRSPQQPPQPQALTSQQLQLPPQHSPQMPPPSPSQIQPRQLAQRDTSMSQPKAPPTPTQQQHPSPPPQRPPPPSEVPPPRDARALRDVMSMHHLEASLAAQVGEAGYPGPSPSQRAAMQQQQARELQQREQQQRAQQAQAAAYGKGGMLNGQQHQQQLQQLQQQQQYQAAQAAHAAQQAQAQAAQAAQARAVQEAHAAHAAQAAQAAQSAQALQAAQLAAQAKAGARQLAQQQSQQSQANASRGNRTSPATGWQYVDPKRNIQGPFTLLEMQQWNAMGYFRPDLPMRCDPSDEFVPFMELFPHPLVPFQSYPKRPQQRMSMR